VTAKATALMSFKSVNYRQNRLTSLQTSVDYEMKKAIVIIMWIVTFMLGWLVAGLCFKEETLQFYLVFITWTFIVAFIVLKFFSKNGHVILIRVLSLIFLEVAMVLLLLRVASA